MLCVSRAAGQKKVKEEEKKMQKKQDKLFAHPLWENDAFLTGLTCLLTCSNYHYYIQITGCVIIGQNVSNEQVLLVSR